MIILFGEPLFQFLTIAAVFANIIYWLDWINKNKTRWSLGVFPITWWINTFLYYSAGLLFRYTDYKLTVQALIVWNTIIIWQAGILITGVGVILFGKPSKLR